VLFADRLQRVRVAGLHRHFEVAVRDGERVPEVVADQARELVEALVRPTQLQLLFGALGHVPGVDDDPPDCRVVDEVTGNGLDEPDLAGRGPELHLEPDGVAVRVAAHQPLPGLRRRGVAVQCRPVPVLALLAITLPAVVDQQFLEGEVVLEVGRLVAEDPAGRRARVPDDAVLVEAEHHVRGALDERLEPAFEADAVGHVPDPEEPPRNPVRLDG